MERNHSRACWGESLEHSVIDCCRLWCGAISVPRPSLVLALSAAAIILFIYPLTVRLSSIIRKCLSDYEPKRVATLHVYRFTSPARVRTQHFGRAHGGPRAISDYKRLFSVACTASKPPYPPTHLRSRHLAMPRSAAVCSGIHSCLLYTSDAADE